MTFVEGAVAVAVLSGKAEVPGVEGPSQEDGDELSPSFCGFLLSVSGGIWENLMRVK